MPIEFTPWPDVLARRYRDKGYWRGEPLTEILRVHASHRHPTVSRSFAAIDISLTLSSTPSRRDLRRASRDAESSRAIRRSFNFPNVAEFYIVFFALLKMGVAPVNALFSHDRLEMTAYAQQLQPKLLIASAEHRLFADDVYVTGLRSFAPTLSVVAIHGRTEYAENLESLWECDLDGAADEPRPSAADQVAFFQLSGGSTGVPKLIPRTHDDYYYSVRRSAEICGLTAESRYLCALPAPHNYPLSSPGALGVFHVVGTVVMVRNPSADLCFDHIRRHKVNFTAIVPTIASLWLDAAANRLSRSAELSQ